MTPEPFARLVDPRFGILRRLAPETLPSYLPVGLRCARAEIGDSRAFTPWPSDAAGGGLAWWNDAAALAAAAGEAVERYCGNLVPSRLRRASYSELAEAGEPALDPADLALYSEGQYQTRGFPFVRFRRDLRVLWTGARELVTGDRLLVPASLVWTSWGSGPTAREPNTNGTIFAGLAAGTTREAAERGALAEAIERDALHLAWSSGARLPRLVPPEWMAPLLASPGGETETQLYLFPTDLGLPVVGAVLRDRETGGTAMGCACRADPVAAALKAMAEAAQLSLVSRAFAQEESPLLARLAAVPGAALRPWRADRAYVRLFGPDWRGARDLLCHLQIYLDPALQEPLAERLAGGGETPLEQVGAEGPETLPTYLSALAARGFHVLSVEVATQEVAAAGLSVVRAIVPGLSSNAPHAFPFLGSRRLERLGGARCTLPPPYA